MSVVDDPAPPAPGTSQAEQAPHTPASPAPSVVAELRAATVRHGETTLLPPVDLTVNAGEVVAIVGRSGVGKTTLLHVLAGLLAPTSGDVTAHPAALMPQRDGLMPWATARDNAALPLRVAGLPRADARAQAERQLDALGLAGLGGRRTARLSGGQRQRVALARTLLTGRELLLLDEPFAAVDALTRDELHDLLLAHLGAEGRAAVLVTHDVEEAVRLADRLLVLTRGAGLVMPAVPLLARPGDRLAARGGESLRAAVLEELAR
ncbi:MAG: ABC transporter ATP-binding protein [Solirubrobacteraceae bacterium]|nr:ABC transporter ATP-binding protein [Solirubrobacteraceae bacterium]